MAKDIVMPKMGYDMTEGKLLRWIKHEGDTITKGEAIAEIETDKVNIEVEAFDSGVLQRVLVQEGDTVPVGQPIGILAAPGEGPRAEEKTEAKAPTAAAPTGPQPPEEQPAAGGGTIKQEPPSTARAMAPERSQTQASAAPGNGHAPAAVATQTHQGGRIKASPLARRLAQEYELDLSAIRGTGPGGRVTRDDVLAAVKAARTAAPAPQPAPAPAPEAAPEAVPKAAARALTKFPTLNASYAGDKLTLHDEINVAVAVAIEDGLVTPVVRHADQKSLGQIARETKALAERARGGKARLEDYEGGTFTVSNLGMYDVDTFVAIINPPQAAILAIGAVRRVPDYEGDNLVPRERMSVTLSADHRVTDGATGARFLAEVRGYLENPLRLVM